MQKRRRRKLSENIKKQIAFNQSWRCKVCSILLPPSYQIDHIIPHAISIDDSINNLQALCPNCHCTKTHKEHNRIIRYKKKRANENCQLCWFCLKPQTKGQIHHLCNCNKKLKDIAFKKPKLSLINSFEKFCHIKDNHENNNENNNENEEDIEEDIEEKDIEEEDNTLVIDLKPDSITANGKIFKFNKEYDIPDIARCVFKATRSKKFSNYFNNVEINILCDIGEGNHSDGLVDFLDENVK